MKKGPPLFARNVLRWVCSHRQLEMLEGDLHELYGKRRSSHGRFHADLHFLWDVLDLIRPFAVKKIDNRRPSFVDMFKNYLKVSIRNIQNQKIYSFLNITGLAIGLACFLLIFLYIRDELSYDRMHTKADRTYRMTELFQSDGIGEHSASQPFGVGPTLASDFTGIIDAYTRMFNFQSPTLALANRSLDKEFNESRLFFVDSTFFDVFDFRLIAGDPNTALDEPNSILITRTMAKKYFDNEDPIGKVLEFQGEHNYQVTGILEDAPLNAHFQFDGLISFSSLKAFYEGHYPETWYWNPCWTYVVVNENVTISTLEEFFPQFIDKYFPDFIKEDLTLIAQPLTEIHLHSRLDYEIQANGNINNVYIFSAVALFVLLIAIINFINLSTARATKRAKEVGVRKSLGSSKGQLISQFITESLIYTVLAVLMALVLVVVMTPYFNQLTQKSIHLMEYLEWKYLLSLMGLIFIIGLLSGFYPAFVLSSFKTTLVIKNAQFRARGLNFRKILVTFQFAISILLIVATIIALKQLNHLQYDDPGFEKEHVLMIPVIRSPMGQHYEAFKTTALQNPNILSMTGVEEIVGAKHQVANYAFGTMDKTKPFPHFQVRHDFLKTFDIPLLAGRTFDERILTDDTLALVINETLMKNVGWDTPEEAVGGDFRFGRYSGKVIGVVRNYNFVSKHHPIAPLVIALNLRPSSFNLFIKYVAVRINSENPEAAIAHLIASWDQFIQNRPFDYFYLDDRLNESYEAERKLSNVTTIFSFLAILVACLGLFGLATFSVEQRTKEIGIRKVLGIDVRQILWLLSSEFFILILIAFVVSAPLSYLALNEWINGFAYRVDLTLWPFLFAAVVTLMVALITISFHALKASRINPSEVLKYE